MKSKNVFLRRLWFWIFISIIILCSIVGSVYFFGIKIIEAALFALNSPETATSHGQEIAKDVLIHLKSSMGFGLPAIGLFIFILGILLRWILGRSFLKYTDPSGPKKSEKQSEKTPQLKEKIIYKVDKNKEKLLYAHILSAFQREGQWVDFLNENLDLYEDEQIGAAVRNIQENCKKVLNSHFNLKPILGQNQGEEITLEEGFSPDTIKLVGNVQGSPPFKGIIRHKGWKIQKVDIPDFSGEQNTGILAPAEVEIL